MKPKFSPGAKVFAKVRGYPPWPARIEGCADETPKKEKYHVYFYGTGETAVVKIQDVFDFVENRNKMGKLKKLKNFTEAMQQVEGELTPEQKAAIKALDSEQTASPSVKDTEKGKDKESKDSETPKDKEKESKVDSSETIPAPSRRASTTNKTAKTTTPAASVKPVAKDNKRKLELDSSAEDPAPTPKKPNTAATPQSTSATSEKKDDKSQSKAAEPHSRSGRKIKPKKFTDFEDDDKEEQKVDSSPAKEDEKKPKEVRRPAPRPKSLKVPDDNADSGAGDWYLLARGQEPIKIPIKLNRPNFDDNKPRSITTSQWEDMVFEEARALKKRIENGEKFSEAAASDYMERFTKVKAATVHILRSPEEEEQFKKQTIDVETALLEVEFNIRNALTLKGADTKTCLQQLDKLKGLRVTALMLKKHSQIVHTMRKLRRYVGNPIVWNMNDDEMNEFNADAEKIRTKAEEIVNSFKTLFFQPHSVSFWDHFSNELAAFNAKTKHMSMEDVFSIITEPE